MSRFAIALLLLLGSASLLGQTKQRIDKVPDLFEYHRVDLAPEALNQQMVRKSIGYPPKAIKAGIRGKVFCRVLVDEKGNYVRHELTRIDHPLLGKAVDPHVHYLRFSPAFIKKKPVSTWTNVVFSFHEADQRYEFNRVKLEPAIVKRLNNPLKRAHYFQAEGDQSLKDRNLRSALRMYSQVIAIGKEKRKKTSYQRLSFHAYAARSEVQRLQGNLESAIEDITEAVGLAKGQLTRQKACQERLPKLYQTRSELYLEAGMAYQALEDLRWIEHAYACMDPFIHAQIAEVYIQLSQLDEARLALEEIQPCKEKSGVKENSTLRAYRHVLEGILYLEENELEKAFASWQASIDEKGLNPMAYFYKGLTIQAAGGSFHACENLRIALEMGLTGKRAEKAEALIKQLGCSQDLSLK